MCMSFISREFQINYYICLTNNKKKLDWETKIKCVGYCSPATSRMYISLTKCVQHLFQRFHSLRSRFFTWTSFSNNYRSHTEPRGGGGVWWVSWGDGFSCNLSWAQCLMRWWRQDAQNRSSETPPIDVWAVMGWRGVSELYTLSHPPRVQTKQPRASCSRLNNAPSNHEHVLHRCWHPIARSPV